MSNSLFTIFQVLKRISQNGSPLDAMITGNQSGNSQGSSSNTRNNRSDKSTATKGKHDLSGDCQYRFHVRSHLREGRRVSSYERRCGQDHSPEEAERLNREGKPNKQSDTKEQSKCKTKLNGIFLKKNDNTSFEDDNVSGNAVIRRSIDFIAPYEGFVDYAYFDSNGNLTTGYGTLIPNKEAYTGMNWQKQGHCLTNTQKEVNYDKIMDLKDEYGSNRIADSQTKMKEFGFIPETDLRIMAEDHIQNKTIPSLQKTLARDGVQFNQLPPSVQMALIDIEYNTGNFKSFSKMREAIQKMDFETMIKESHRRFPVSEKRNNAVRRLILQGQQEMAHKSKYGIWE